MKPLTAATVCNAIIFGGLSLLAFSLPLLFLPFTTELLETNKQALLFVVSTVVAGAWLVKMLVTKEVAQRNSIANAAVLLFLLAYVVSALTSLNPYIGFLGGGSQAKAGVLTVLCCVALYFVIIHCVTDQKKARYLLGAAVCGGIFAAAIAITQGLGIYLLPFSVTHTSVFTTVGSPAALVMFMAYIVSVAAGLVLSAHADHECRGAWCAFRQVVLVILACIPLATIAMVDYLPNLLVLAVGAVTVILFVILHPHVARNGRSLALAVMSLVGATLLFLLPFPFKLAFPGELMPTLGETARVSYNTLRERPLFGSGPATYIYDSAKYRSPELVQFDRGSSRLLTIAATTGIAGILTHLLLIGIVAGLALKNFFNPQPETWTAVVPAVAGWTTLIVARAIYSSTITLEVAFWMTTAIIVAMVGQRGRQVAFAEAPRARLVVISLLTVLGIGAVTSSFILTEKYIADIAYVKAIVAVSQSGNNEEAAQYLKKAIKHQATSDTYLRALAKVRLEQAMQKSKAVVTSQAEKQKKNEEIISLANEAVELGIRATVVGKHDAVNWSTLAAIYQNLMGVTKGADLKAIEAYARAIESDPVNPTLHADLAKVYIFQHDQLLGSREQLTAQATEILKKASDESEAARALYPQYATASYLLALVRDRQGKLDEALPLMETASKLDPQDAGVRYQLALLYYRFGMYEAATKEFLVAIDLAPGFAEARWQLIALYEKQGKNNEALAQIEILLQDDSSNAVILEKKQQLMLGYK